MSFIDWNDEIDWSGWDDDSRADSPPEIFAALDELASTHEQMADDLAAILQRSVSLDPHDHWCQRDGARAWEIVNRRLDDMIYEGLRLP